MLVVWQCIPDGVSLNAENPNKPCLAFFIVTPWGDEQLQQT
jgi:hypothetical protein